MNPETLKTLKAHAAEKVAIAKAAVTQAEAVTKNARATLRTAEAAYRAVVHAQNTASQASDAYHNLMQTAEDASLDVDLDTELALLAATAADRESPKRPKRPKRPSRFKAWYHQNKEDADHFFWMAIIFSLPIIIGIICSQCGVGVPSK